jgi:hypothetical protein
LRSRLRSRRLHPRRSLVAERQTTQPNIVYTIPAVLTDTKIELTHNHVPRGAMIRYTIVNRGSRPYAFQIWKAKTRPISTEGPNPRPRELGLPRAFRLPNAVSRQAGGSPRFITVY